jgi:hypothetical protein
VRALLERGGNTDEADDSRGPPGGCHGSTQEDEQETLQFWRAEIRAQRNEAPQERLVAERQRRTRWTREESEASDRHWPFRSTEERREGAAENVSTQNSEPFADSQKEVERLRP